MSLCLSLSLVHVHPQRISIEDIRNDEWFKRSYVPAGFLEYEDVNLDDINAVFDDPEVGMTFNCHLSSFHFVKL